jgi:hypothetical protein
VPEGPVEIPSGALVGFSACPASILLAADSQWVNWKHVPLLQVDESMHE